MKKELRLIAFDSIKRKYLRKLWLRRKIIVAFLNFSNVILLMHQSAALKLSEMVFRRAAVSFYKNRCVLTGRSHAVNSTFKMSRFAIRTAVNGGYINGLRRAS